MLYSLFKRMHQVERSSSLNVPKNALSLVKQMYQYVLPKVHEELNKWRKQADAIPNPELRKQALASIQFKTFHCEGGAIFSLLALENRDEAIRFIVAFQTISDYLDNLCDRSTSLDANDFRRLHEAIFHALNPEQKPINYYKYRNDQNDGGYLQRLVETCQSVIRNLPYRDKIEAFTYELASYYCDLQVHKHVKKEERVPRLLAWYKQHEEKLPNMSWFEFSACAGSTIGIFCLVSYALRNFCEGDLFSQVMKSYFPWVQGMHILLDYFIDQQEDREAGDLNFCFYYDNDDELIKRFVHFIQKAQQSVQQLPDASFHQMIQAGMLGIYLTDKKVSEQKKVSHIAKYLLKQGGRWATFFYYNSLAYRRIKKLAAIF